MHEETKGSKVVKWILIGISVLFLFIMLVLPLATVLTEAGYVGEDIERGVKERLAGILGRSKRRIYFKSCFAYT